MENQLQATVKDQGYSCRYSITWWSQKMLPHCLTHGLEKTFSPGYHSYIHAAFDVVSLFTDLANNKLCCQTRESNGSEKSFKVNAWGKITITWEKCKGSFLNMRWNKDVTGACILCIYWSSMNAKLLVFRATSDSWNKSSDSRKFADACSGLLEI